MNCVASRIAGEPFPAVAVFRAGSFSDKIAANPPLSILNAHGFAVLSFNGYGRGLGAATTMTVRRNDGTAMTFPAPGLGYDQNADGEIATWEPMRPLRPPGVLNLSGTVLQTVAFDFAIVRALQAGVDVDGDGATDLDAARIYRFGQSQGAVEGLIAFTLEPAIRAAVFNVPSGTANYNTLGQPMGRGLFGSALAARVPSLVNAAYGITTIDGVAVAPPHWNENLPLRDEPVRVNTVPGAIEIQQALDRTVWAAQASNVVAFAPMLRRALPPGVPNSRINVSEM